MTFIADISDDFETILESEYSSRVVFHLDSADWDTRGIFDETYEEVQLDEGAQPIAAKITRVTIYYKNRPADVTIKTLMTYHPDTGDTVDYIVLDIQDESEGNALITLRKDESS